MLTLLFSDLVGSTALSEQLDPEDMREVINDYQQACTTVIRQYNGYVAKFLGDGVLAYFGFPTATEDDAKQSVRAGLALVEAVNLLRNRYLGRFDIQTSVRVGIHTGLTVVGDALHGDHHERNAVTGSVPNIAARIQSEAKPNTVLISADTNKLIGAAFDRKDLGLHELKGVARPIHLYRVDFERTAASRLEARSEGFTDFTGRQGELSALRQQWDHILTGTGSVAIVGGDPGVGKSRLVHEIKKWAASTHGAWLTELQCSPFHQNTSLYPVIEFLERVVFQFTRHDSPAQRLEKILGWVTQYGLDSKKAVPLLCSLLSVPLSDDFAPLSLSPQKVKERTFDILISVVERRSFTQPVLFVIEDLHWADASTLELIDEFVRRVKDKRVMTVLTHRPYYKPPFDADDNVKYYPLGGLEAQAIEAIIHHAAGDKPLPPEVVKYIRERTDGIPLFVEEMTKALIESDVMALNDGGYVLNSKLEAIPVPSTLKGSLTARLDRMPQAKPVAQLAATIGREFSHRLIEAVADSDVKDLDEGLNQLVDAGLLFRKQQGEDVRYIFKHALVQDTAYESLLKNARRKYHRSIADAMVESYPELVETQPELLAHHYTQAGEGALAIPHWQRAGQMAIGRSAMPEAIAHLTILLQLVEELPDGAEKIGAELAGQTYMGLAVMQSSGYAHPGVGQAFTRARELCRLIGDPPQVFLVLHGLVKYHLVIGEYEHGLSLARQLLATAEAANDTLLKIEALYAIAAALTWMGRHDEAKIAAAELESLYDPETHGSAAATFGEDPFLAATGHRAWGLMVQGYTETAQLQIEELYSQAFTNGHPWTITYAMTCGVHAQHAKRDVEATYDYARQMHDAATEYGFPFWHGPSSVLLGWARVLRGEVEQGIADMGGGIALWRMLGAVLGLPNFLLCFAEGNLVAGDVDAALQAVAESLDLIATTKEELYLSCAHRMMGNCLSAQGKVEEANASYRTALRVAQEQGAHLWGVAAAVDLYRSRPTNSDLSEVRQILADSIKAVPEGANAPIMQEARALLAS